MACVGAAVRAAKARTRTLVCIFACVLVAAPLVEGKEIALLISSPVVAADGSSNAFFSRVKDGCERAVLEVFSSAMHSCVFHVESPGDPTAVSKYSVPANYAHIFGIGFEWLDAIVAAAHNYTTMTYSIVDTQPSTPLPNVQGIVFAEDQGGFMAGFVAGLFTQSRTVGVIAGIPFASLRKFRNGFLRGALFVCPFCNVLGTYIPTFADTTVALAATKAQLDQGADVFFAAAGGVSEPSALYAAGRGAYVIGVDSDFRLTSFRNSSDPRTQMLITSSEKRTDVAAYLSLKDKFSGAFNGGTKLIDVSVDGLLLSPCSSNRTCALYAEQIPTTQAVEGTDCTVIRLQSRDQRIKTIQSQLANRQLSTGVDASGNILDLVDTGSRDWAPLRPFGLNPPPIKGHTVVVTPDNVLVMFGGETEDAITATTYELDYDNLEWRRITPPLSPPARTGHTSVYFGGRVFVYGGFSPSHTALGDTWAYNTVNRTWSAVPTIATPAGRTSHATALDGAEMFVYGGLSSLTLVSELWSLNLVTFAWQQYGPLSVMHPPPLRGPVLLAPGDGKLYLFGGQDATGVSSSLYAFNIAARTWTLLSPAGKAPQPAWGAAGAVLGTRRLLFAGGISSDAILGDVVVYNIARNEWVAGESRALPKPTQAHALVVFNQSAKAVPCDYADIPGIAVCTPQRRPLLMALGGVDGSGITGAAFVAFVVDEAVVGGGRILSYPSSSDSNTALKVALPVVLSVSAVVLTTAFVVFRIKSRQIERSSKNWIIQFTELEFLSQLGEGGYGKVFLCVYRGSEVAVKTLRVGAFDIGGRALEKFERLRQMEYDDDPKLSSRSTLDTSSRRQNKSAGNLAPNNNTNPGEGGGNEEGSKKTAPSSSKKSRRTILDRAGEAMAAKALDNVLVATQKKDPKEVAKEKAKIKKAMANFLKEIETMSKLRHPNIVMFLGASINMEELCIVTEYMSAGSLYDLYRNPDFALSWERCLGILLDACRGMQFLHASKPPILHLDIKSANLLCEGGSYKCKIADFGLASLQTDTTRMMNGPRGTILWMPPELLVETGQATTKSDVYSFGIVMTELLNRALPYSEHKVTSDPKSLGRLVVNIARGLRPSILAGCDESFKTIVRKCLNASPLARPSFDDIADMMQMLPYETFDPAIFELARVKLIERIAAKEALIAKDAEAARVKDTEAASKKAALISPALPSAISSDSPKEVQVVVAVTRTSDAARNSRRRDSEALLHVGGDVADDDEAQIGEIGAMRPIGAGTDMEEEALRTAAHPQFEPIGRVDDAD